MSALASAVEELLRTAVLGEKAAFLQKKKTDWALKALSVLFAGIGLLFVIVAIDRHLENIYPPALAAVICAGGLFAAALLSFCMTRCSQRQPAPPADNAPNPLAENLREIIEEVFLELEGPIKDNPKMAVLLAAMAGFLVANNHLKL